MGLFSPARHYITFASRYNGDSAVLVMRQNTPNDLPPVGASTSWWETSKPGLDEHPAISIAIRLINSAPSLILPPFAIALTGALVRRL
jgi:hypothetical protein